MSLEMQQRVEGDKDDKLKRIAEILDTLSTIRLWEYYIRDPNGISCPVGEIVFRKPVALRNAVIRIYPFMGRDAFIMIPSSDKMKVEKLSFTKYSPPAVEIHLNVNGMKTSIGMSLVEALALMRMSSLNDKLSTAEYTSDELRDFVELSLAFMRFARDHRDVKMVTPDKIFTPLLERGTMLVLRDFDGISYVEFLGLSHDYIYALYFLYGNLTIYSRVALGDDYTLFKIVNRNILRKLPVINVFQEIDPKTVKKLYLTYLEEVKNAYVAVRTVLA